MLYRITTTDPKVEGLSDHELEFLNCEPNKHGSLYNVYLYTFSGSVGTLTNTDNAIKLLSVTHSAKVKIF